MQQYNKKPLLVLTLTLCLGIGSTGCTLQRMVRTAERKQEITVSPNPLAANGQQVNFELKAQVPESLVRDKQTYKLDVFYEYDQKQENVGTYSFQFGEFIYEGGKPTVTRQLSFPYSPQKNKGRLMVQGRAISNTNGNVRYTGLQQVATGLATTPLLLVRENTFDFIPDSYKAKADGPAKYTFFFDPNEAKLRTSPNPRLQVLDQYVLDNVGSQTITITASQSPDEADSKLAEKRAKVLEEYYLSRIKTLDYSGKKVTINTTARKADLELLLQKLQASALPKAEKQEAIAILRGKLSQKEKVEALETAQAYDYIERYIFPVLRAAEIELNYNRNRKPDYALYILAKKIAEEKVDADVLTEEEMHYAATLTPLLEEKRRFYEASVKSTDKWPAYYNLGVVYTEMARKEYRQPAKQALLAKAIHNLSFAGFRNPAPNVYYSLASAYHLRGDMLEALQYYEYAIRLGGDEKVLQRVFADKAALEIEVGQYDDAIASLRYAGDTYQTNMNLGLSYLLKENYEGAERFYGRALELKPKDALTYYCLALIGARTQNEQMLEQNLRSAVQADKSFVQRAIDDTEFAAYRDVPAYKDALLR